MPGGFNLSVIKSYLSKSWGLGPQRADGVLLLGTTLEPPKRLGSEAEAKAWFDRVVTLYTQRSGITLSSASSGGSGSGGGGGAVMNSEEFLKFQAEQYQFAGQQIELYSRYLKKDSCAGDLKYDAEKANSLALQALLDAISREHDDFYVDGILPAFDALKARRFDSSWNWARQDAPLMWYNAIHGKLTTVNREITARCIDILNRADPDLYQFMQYNVNACDRKHPPSSVLGPRVIETFPVVKPLVAAESRMSNNSGSPRPDSPSHYATTNSLKRSRSTQVLSLTYTTSSLQEQMHHSLGAGKPRLGTSGSCEPPYQTSYRAGDGAAASLRLREHPRPLAQGHFHTNLYDSVINSLSTKDPETQLKAARVLSLTLVAHLHSSCVPGFPVEPLSPRTGLFVSSSRLRPRYFQEDGVAHFRHDHPSFGYTVCLCSCAFHSSPLRIPHNHLNHRPKSTPHMYCRHRTTWKTSPRFCSGSPGHRNFPRCQASRRGGIPNAKQLRLSLPRLPTTLRYYQQPEVLPIYPGPLPDIHNLFPPRTDAEPCRFLPG